MNKNGAGQSACYRSLADEQYYGVHDWWQTDRPERKTCSHGGFTNYETPRPNNDLPGRGGQRNRRRAVRHRDYLEIDVVHTHVDIRRDLYGRVRDLEFNIAHALSIELSARPIGSLGVDLLEPLLGSHVEVRDPPPERRNTGGLQRHLLEHPEQVGVLARHIATEYLRVADAAHPRVALEDRDDIDPTINRGPQRHIGRCHRVVERTVDIEILRECRVQTKPVEIGEIPNALLTE